LRMQVPSTRRKRDRKLVFRPGVLRPGFRTVHSGSLQIPSRTER
jgi:hypothetical protein